MKFVLLFISLHLSAINLSIFPDVVYAHSLKECSLLQKQGYFCWKQPEGYAFVHSSFFYNDDTAEFLKTHEMENSRYRFFYQPVLDHYYYIDDDEEDTLKTVLNRGGDYEWVQSIVIKELTKPNSIAIDVGAHIGVHTITMSKKVGPSGTVLSFEPHQKLYMEHLYNLKINQCENVVPICKALGNEAKKGRLKRIKIEEEGDPIDVVTLDSYRLNGISFIKIDVENYEYFVLKGAKETILRNKPAILFECFIDCDFDDISLEKQKENFDRTMSLLQSYGYRIYMLYNCDFIALPSDSNDQHKLIPIDPANYNSKQEFQYPRQFDQYFGS